MSRASTGDTTTANGANDLTNNYGVGDTTYNYGWGDDTYDYGSSEHNFNYGSDEYGWGGYLIWHAPQIKTFIDGRADLFVYNGIFDDYLKIVRIEETFELLDRHRIQYALLERHGPLPYVLGHSACWREIYNDPQSVIFERSG